MTRGRWPDPPNIRGQRFASHPPIHRAVVRLDKSRIAVPAGRHKVSKTGRDNGVEPLPRRAGLRLTQEADDVFFGKPLLYVQSPPEGD